jgi:hypothetical protein
MFFAHDPGGCNAIFPLIDAFRLRNHDVSIYAAGPAAVKIPEALNLSSDCLENVLRCENPDFIITGTSINDFTERFMWKTAKNCKIPSMAVFDHWLSYGIRFSKYGLRDVSLYNSDKSVDFLPSYIVVMDDFAKSEMQNDGIPASIIYPLGNPHFALLKNKSKNVDVAKTRSKFLKNNKNNKIVTFASEPYEEESEDCSVSPERKALADISRMLNHRSDITLVVKLHPKEHENKYCEITQCIFDKKTDSIDMIMASDVVVSMTSMVLIEAAILGKKIISYQPNESNKNKFILTRNNVIEFINNPDELNRSLIHLLNGNDMQYNFDVNFNGVINIVNFVEDKLCQS